MTVAKPYGAKEKKVVSSSDILVNVPYLPKYRPHFLPNTKLLTYGVFKSK